MIWFAAHISILDYYVSLVFLSQVLITPIICYVNSPYLQNYYRKAKRVGKRPGSAVFRVSDGVAISCLWVSSLDYPHPHANV